MAGTLSLDRGLRKKKSLEVQGLAISATVAISGAAGVAWGMAAVGSTAGAGTSICGGGAAGGASTGFERSSQCDPNKQRTTMAARTAISRGLEFAGFPWIDALAAATPGI